MGRDSPVDHRKINQNCKNILILFVVKKNVTNIICYLFKENNHKEIGVSNFMKLQYCVKL